MLIRTGLGGQLSGSAGGVTASHNRYGQYLRNRTIPVNPRSINQERARSIFGTASEAWRSLTPAQRESWLSYADGTPVLNKLGESVTLSPNAMFTKVASYFALLGLAAPTDAPPTPGLSSLGTNIATNLVLSAATQSLRSLEATAVGLTATRFALQIGPSLSDGVNYVGNRFTFAGSDTVDANIANAAMPFGPLVVGQRRPVRVTGTDGEGRLATPFLAIVTVTT